MPISNANWNGYLRKHAYPFTLKILNSVWAPPNLLCFRAAVMRLVYLSSLTDYSAAHELGFPRIKAFQKWLKSFDLYLQEMEKRPKDSYKRYVECIKISPVKALRRPEGNISHPLNTYGQQFFPIYSLLLITPPAKEYGKSGFDALVSQVVLMGVIEHLTLGLDKYTKYVDEFNDYKWKDQAVDTSLIKISALWSRFDGARKGIATLQQDKKLIAELEILDEDTELQHVIDVLEEIVFDLQHKDRNKCDNIKKILTLLKNNPIQTRKKSKSASATRNQDSSTKVQESLPEEGRQGTYYNPIDLDQLVEPPPAKITQVEDTGEDEDEDESDDDDSEITDGSIYFDEDEEEGEDDDPDLPMAERKGLAKVEIVKLKRPEQTEKDTLKIWSRNRADFLRRKAEQQPYSGNYLNLDTRREVINTLIKVRDEDDSFALAANLMLLSIAVGRHPEMLVDAILPISRKDDLTEEHVVIADSVKRELHIRINQPTLSNPPRCFSQKIEDWIIVPDFLGLAQSFEKYESDFNQVMNAFDKLGVIVKSGVRAQAAFLSD